VKEFALVFKVPEGMSVGEAFRAASQDILFQDCYKVNLDHFEVDQQLELEDQPAGATLTRAE
jgi:hypothetical protein